MSRLFTLDAQLIHDVVFQGIAIFLLFTALSYLLFEPVRKILEDRRKKIQDNKEEAEKERNAANEFRIEYETKLKEIEKEAERILSEARKKALKNEAVIIDEAKEEAKRVLDRARMDIELERKKALDDMKQEIITVAAFMAQQVVDVSVDIKIQDELIEKTLKDMGECTWQN